ENQGDGTFAPHREFRAGYDPCSVTSADLDRDGYRDLVVTNCYDDDYWRGLPGTMSVLLNKCSCPGASWANYGSGGPGTNGIPSFTAASEPKLCTTVTLTLANSLGVTTMAILFIGLMEADAPTPYDGHVLVVPRKILPHPLPTPGLTFDGALPCDGALCGLSVYLQAVEVDPGASKGISFTRGLQLILGS